MEDGNKRRIWKDETLGTEARFQKDKKKKKKKKDEQGRQPSKHREKRRTSQ